MSAALACVLGVLGGLAKTVVPWILTGMRFRVADGLWLTLCLALALTVVVLWGITAVQRAQLESNRVELRDASIRLGWMTADRTARGESWSRIDRPD